MDKVIGTMKKVDSISAQLVLAEAYDVAYGIYDHDIPDAHPWGVVLHSHKEDYSEYGPLYRTFYQYRLKDIGKLFNISISEFLDLPREYVNLMLRIATEETLVDNDNLDKIKDKLDKEQQNAAKDR